jgi:hypothetical protein
VVNPLAMAADGQVTLAGTLGAGVAGGRCDGNAVAYGDGRVAVKQCDGGGD